MDSKRVQRNMALLLESLDYDFSDFSIPDFSEWLEQQRGQPILFHPRSLPSKLFGAWVPGPRADHIFFEEHTLPLHQKHIKLHELSHLICGHQVKTVSDSDIESLLHATSADSTTFQKTLQRSLNDYTNRQEVEAETLATLISQRAIGRDRKSQPDSSHTIWKF